MRKRLFGRVVLVVILGVALGGCASMREFCGHEAEQKEVIAASQPAPAVVRPAPAPAPAPVPAPPPKKARN